MTPLEFRRRQKELQQLKTVEPEVNISNTLVEALIKKNNLVGLKILFYLAKAEVKLDPSKPLKIITFKIDEKNLCDYCNIEKKTLRRNIKRLQETVIEFVDREKNTIEDIVMIPYAKYFVGKNRVEVHMYTKMLKLVMQVANNFTPINIENLVKLGSKHSVRMLMLLEYINTFSENSAKRKTYTLAELNGMFGTEYERLGQFEQKILNLSRNK